jgi:penicillin-binding protein 2
MSVVQYGMFLVSKYGSPSEIFGSYPIDVASKTGTAQLGEGKENNAVFVAYAPYENPEIAVAVVVEGGGSGASVVQIARDVFDYWFTYRKADSSNSSENQLLK